MSIQEPKPNGELTDSQLRIEYDKIRNSKAGDDFGEILKKVSNYANVFSHGLDKLDYLESKGLMYKNNGWEGMYIITDKGKAIYTLYLDDLMN